MIVEVRLERGSSPVSGSLGRVYEEGPRSIGMEEEGNASLPLAAPWLEQESLRWVTGRCTA
jgi:hypothetical protein